jgi:O-antigen ligase
VTGAVRDAAAILAAVGIAGLLVPLPWVRAEVRRGVALVLTLAAWFVLLGSLVPSEDARDGLDRVASPGSAALAVAALLGLCAVGALGVRLVLRHPTLWFVLLGVALPIRTPVSFGSQEASLLVPLYAVILLGLAAWIWGRLRGGIAGSGPEGPRVLNLPLAAFVAYVLLSILWSADPAEGAARAAFFYLPFVLLYLLVLAWWPRARALAALAVTTLAGASVAALVGLYQYATREIWWNETLQQANVYSRFFRVNGIFYDPNILGRYLAIGILTALALAWVRRRPVELAGLGAVTVVMGAGLMVTFSRSSALMLMVGLVLLAARAVGPLRAAAGGAALLLVLGGASIAASGNIRHAVTDGDRLERVSEGRFDLMEGGLEIWRDDPVLGAGLGGFERRFEETLTPVEQRRVRVVVSHNAPVTVLSEAGLAGAGLFLLLIVGAGWATARGSRDQGDAGWARWTLSAQLGGILVHSLLYAALFEDPFTWVIAAGAVALAGLRPAQVAAPRPEAPEPLPVP